MLKVAYLVLLAVGTIAVELEGTELQLTFLVHRHGARTPIESSLKYSNDPEKLAKLSKPYGYGQLTNAGKREGYQLGKFIRKRYDKLLSPQYNMSEVFIRSTDSTRTEMTILLALAAIYPPQKNNWSKRIRWTPVPYTTVPIDHDFMVTFPNCPVLPEVLPKLKPSSEYMDKYGDVIRLMSNASGTDLSQSPFMVYMVHDLFVSQRGLGLPLDPEIEAKWPEVQAAAGAAADIVFGDENYIALQAGVLLNEFNKAASEIISGTDSRRVRIYSAHDINVFTFEAVTKITNKQGVPKYASAYALELRRVLETGKYVVVPVYLPSPGEEVKYLEVEGCGSICDYQQFVNTTSMYALDKKTWRTKCGNKDLENDDSYIA